MLLRIPRLSDQISGAVQKIVSRASESSFPSSATDTESSGTVTLICLPRLSSSIIDHKMNSPAIPALATLTDASAVDQTISLLLEPSPILHSKLTPAITQRIASSGVPETYSQLVDLCADEIWQWSPEDKAAFLGGHPLIGEVKNLSAMSAKEQGGKTVRTPEIVLRRYSSRPFALRFRR